jgi:cell wall-associated NlpC family hydrolase
VATADGHTGSASIGSDGAVPGGPATTGRSWLDQAKATVRARQALADRLQADLAAADRQSRSLAARAGLAAEAHDAAVAHSAEAHHAAAQALARFDAARQAQDAAVSHLGLLAAAAYRQGPDLSRLLAFAHVDSLREFTDREEVLSRLAETEAAAVRAARDATEAAKAARQQAQDAVAVQEAAERAARSASDEARTLAAAEQNQAAQLRTQREATLVQLAQAQGVELALERQRQQALAEQAARQEAARQEASRQEAARQEAARQATKHTAAAKAGPPPAAAPIPYAAGPAHALLAYVYAQLGKPYVWGGAGPDVFDCSGLAMRGLEAAGWSFPHPAQWQYLAMHPVHYADLQPGDLVFWAENSADPHTIYHEAIAIGGDRIIQAPRPGGVVEVQSLWTNGAPSFYARP